MVLIIDQQFQIPCYNMNILRWFKFNKLIKEVDVIDVETF